MTPLNTLIEAIPLLLNGQVGVVPTDTVYGLAACASNEQAVTRLYALKHRERKPGNRHQLAFRKMGGSRPDSVERCRVPE